MNTISRFTRCTKLLSFLLTQVLLCVFLTLSSREVNAVDVMWNTFQGGSSTDAVIGVTVDTNGNVYAVGYSSTTWGNPINAYTAGTDGFVAKFDNNGNVVWNTFLGATGNDEVRGVWLDTNGDIYVTGLAAGTWGSPVRAYTGGNDVFVAKLSNDGSQVWNTFLGGSGSESGYGIIKAPTGDLYLDGIGAATWGTPIRAYSAGNDTLVAKLNANGELQWHTFLGGAGTDVPPPNAIFLGASSNIIIGGMTSVASWGTPLQGYTGLYDSYMASISAIGDLQWNTFFGGSSSEYLRGMIKSPDGYFYLLGEATGTWGSPINAFGASWEGLVTKVDSNGSYIWHTYWGGTGADSALGAAVDPTSGNVYVWGASAASWGAPLRAYTAGYDNCLLQYTSGGSLNWHTFFGGSGDDNTIAGKAGLSIDSYGNIYASGVSSATWGTPVRAYTAGIDGFVTKIDVASPTTTDNIATSWHNTAVTVWLQCTDNSRGSGCATTYYTTDGSTPTTSSSSGTSFTLSTDGEYTIKYFSVDAVGNEETPKTATNTVKIDKTAPTGALQITSSLTGGKTKTRNITLGVTADGTGSTVTDMMLSENAMLTGASWESYAASKSFALSSGDGSKTVYAKVKDAAGNESTIFSITVTLDTKTLSSGVISKTQSIGGTVTPTPTVTEEPTETPTPTIMLIDVQIKDRDGNILRNTVVYINGDKYTTDGNGKIYVQEFVIQNAKVEVRVNGKDYSGDVLGGTIVVDITQQTASKKVSYTWLWWILAFAVITALLYTYGKSKKK